MKPKLNLGCGNDIKKDYINLDKYPLDGVDIIHDIEQIPLPFDDDTFEQILCNDILEHVDYPRLIIELYRILKKEGILEIRVPHFTARSNYVDPTHKKLFSYRTLDFFVKNTKYKLKRPYYYNVAYSKIKTKIIFNKKVFLYNYIIEPIINSHHNIKEVYELTGLCSLFPAKGIIFKLYKEGN